MNAYITGGMIRTLREKKQMTQSDLAARIGVTDKAVSKWETGKGYPDITLLPTLAEALGVSVMELFSGNAVENRNRSGNMKRLCFYVCPVCGNVITALGESVICCCGVPLMPAEAEPVSEQHDIRIEPVEDEYFVTLDHPMEKDHSISFLAAVSDEGVQLVKLYPEGAAQARFKRSRVRTIYAYCNRHGLYRLNVPFAKK